MPSKSNASISNNNNNRNKKRQAGTIKNISTRPTSRRNKNKSNNASSPSSSSASPSSLLFYEQLSSEITDDDEATIITSNLLRAAASRYEQREHRQGGRRHPNAQLIDKKRAPKIAALLFTGFFLLSGSHYTIRNIRELLVTGNNVNDIDNQAAVAAAVPGQTGRNATNGNNSNNTTTTDGGILDGTAWESNSFQDMVEEMSKPNLDSNGNPIQIPPELSNLADIHIISRSESQSEGSKFEFDPTQETPIFWHVPRSAGTTMKEIATFCYGLTLASEVGAFIDPVAATADELMTVVDANTGAKYLNVDTTSPEGLERAKNFHLASYPNLDLIVSPYIFMASDALFRGSDDNSIDSNTKGRLIVFLRHPIDRAVSMYYYLRDKTGIRGAQIGDTIDLYAKSSMVENNWMTRFLTGKMGGELTPDDEALAREVLRTKTIVGLLSKKAESMRRFKEYFHWKMDIRNSNNNNIHEIETDPNMFFDQECEDKLLHWGWSGKNKHEQLEEGSDTWNLLKEQNTFDLRLYEYAVRLFEVQALLFLTR